MSDVPATLRYTEEHEWARAEADGTVTIGITDHAQQKLGELVYVELPEAGRALTAGGAMAVVESTKAASDVYAPVAGEVIAVNDALVNSPELVNASPYGDGWLVRIRPAAGADVAGLLDAAAYARVVADDQH
jgi:glycine cleavage system H protein